MRRGRPLGEKEALRYLVPGAVLRVWYQAGNPNNELLHVRALVDGHAVVRRWSRRRGWTYRVEHPLFFTVRAAHGVLLLVRQREAVPLDDRFARMGEEAIRRLIVRAILRSGEPQDAAVREVVDEVFQKGLHS